MLSMIPSSPARPAHSHALDDTVVAGRVGPLSTCDDTVVTGEVGPLSTCNNTVVTGEVDLLSCSR
jgi:hypothetical protein